MDYNRVYVPLRNIYWEDSSQPSPFEVQMQVYLKHERFLAVRQNNFTSVGTKLTRQAGQSSAYLKVKLSLILTPWWKPMRRKLLSIDWLITCMIFFGLHFCCFPSEEYQIIQVLPGPHRPRRPARGPWRCPAWRPTAARSAGRWILAPPASPGPRSSAPGGPWKQDTCCVQSEFCIG